MRRPITHGTLNAYNSRGCRCDACREAKAVYAREHGSNRRVGTRGEAKNAWDRENRPLCECGQPMGFRSNRCADCRRADGIALRRLIEELWADGLTSRQIAEATGWKVRSMRAYISGLRAEGANLPHRRSPEQVARITAGANANLVKARAAKVAA